MREDTGQHDGGISPDFSSLCDLDGKTFRVVTDDDGLPLLYHSGACANVKFITEGCTDRVDTCVCPICAMERRLNRIADRIMDE